MQRLRLLVLTPRFPCPPVGGDKLRIYELCKHLSQHFELTLLSVCESKSEATAPLPNIDLFSDIYRVHHGRAKRLEGMVRALLTGTPLQVGYYRNRNFDLLVKKLIPQHDGVVAHLIRTAEYARSCSKPRILEMTDAISMAYDRGKALKASSLLWRFLHKFESHRLLTYESKITRSFDLTILTSEVDRDFLVDASTHTAGDIVVCSNGVDTEKLAYSFAHDKKTIVFIGMNTGHVNIDAIQYFVSDIFPLVRARHPDAHFRIIGRIHPRTREKLLKHEGVEVTGSVQDVSRAAKGASVGVCPMRLGAGVQNKLLEYMSLGIPAITSPIGLEGLNAQPGRDLLVAENLEEWANHICSLLENGDRAEAMAKSARQYVERAHAWNMQFEELDKKLFSVFQADKMTDAHAIS